MGNVSAGMAEYVCGMSDGKYVSRCAYRMAEYVYGKYVSRCAYRMSEYVCGKYVSRCVGCQNL